MGSGMSKKKAAKTAHAFAVIDISESMQVKGRLWISKGGETYLSWGRVCLLENIQQTSSIAAAARELQMSYNHAWKLVKKMNQLSGVPLVERQAGGFGGGGAHLTPAGEKAVAAFWDMINDFQQWLKRRDLSEWQS